MGSESLLSAWGVRRAASARSFPATQAAGVTVQKQATRRRKVGLCDRGSRRFTDEVRAGVESRLKKGWTPEIISESAGLEGRPTICKESISAEIGEEGLKRIKMFLNDRPRKCLGWMTPREKLATFLGYTP
jgi:IS30 family transposase